ncbi:hypothetical protein RSOLAG1IB_07980 [Rhizoctonia solani AG-1 IB]|uniref:Uncharacterized protein n=2 Tax=Thanatephorus cucumeris (strain AG1-IB / isolate 7/3/14) TaxID=1108050 RepID=A0A0B7FIA5_THACB|nr:hypothetical protein RSOLAG1IB_07980 [Rhizoctonia solani AG-1 IB]
MVVDSFSVPSRPPSQKSRLEKVTAYTQVSLVATAPPTAMDTQVTTPDGHSRPSQPYDPNVGSTNASGVPHRMSPDPDHSMDWQDVSFASTEADEVIPEDEDEAAYKRRKARERQRRKRMRDREAGIGRNGQPATSRRYSGTDVTHPFSDPPPDSAALAAMTPEEIRKEKTRRAARERQRKHRAVVRARRAEEDTGPDPQPSAGGTSGGIAGNAPAVSEGALPINPSESTAEPHIEQDTNSGEPHPVPYEQPPAFYYPPPGMWPGNPFPHGQFFHTHGHHPGPFVQNGQMMPPPHMMPMLAPQQPPPQTMNPMQMQVSPAPPSPRPAGTPAPAPTPSPAPAAPPEPSPTSTSAPQPGAAPPPIATVLPSFTHVAAPAPAPPSNSVPTPTPAPTPAPASTAHVPAATSAAAPPPAAPAASSPGLPMSTMMPIAGPSLAQPPPSHTPGQTFAMIVSLALNTTQSQLLRAHIMQQLRLTVTDMSELEGVIARAFDAWDRERGGDPSNSQLQHTMQISGALPGMFHHVPPIQPQPIVAPPQTQVSQAQAQAPSQPLVQPAPQPQQPPEPTIPQQSPTQTRVHPPPSTPQNQPRAPRTSNATSRRNLGVGQPQPPTQTPTHPQSQPGGTLNVPRPIAGRSVSVGGSSTRLGSAQIIVAGSSEQSQRAVSQSQRHPHIPPPTPGMRSASSSVTMSIAGQKRPAPNQPGSQARPAPAHPMHPAPAPSGQTRSTTQPSPQIQTRPQSQQQQHSRPGSQPQTPVLGSSSASSGNKSGNGGGGGLTMPVLGHGPSTLA